MNICNTRQTTRLTATFVLLVTGAVFAADGPTAILGKSDWLFYKYELADPSHDQGIQKTIDLLKKSDEVLASKGIRLTVAMVPIKVWVYSEYLPNNTKLNAYTTTNYDRMLGNLKSQNINAADLNSALLASRSWTCHKPLFFRLDSPWAPTGAMAAAEAVKIGLEFDPVSAQLLSSIPSVGYSIKTANKIPASRSRDLVDQLPPNPPTSEPEQVAQVTVTRTQRREANLLGKQNAPDIGSVGRSYSRHWTGFVDVLRDVFQRDVVNVAVNPEQGSWVDTESYLRDDVFQTALPQSFDLENALT